MVDSLHGPARVLLACGPASRRQAIGAALLLDGFHVVTTTDFSAATRHAEEGDVDVIILDIAMLGVDACRRLRALSCVPIVICTTKDSEADRVLGLEAGADDYVVDPFSMPELVARVRAILRRRELDRAEETSRVLRVGDIEVHLSSRLVLVDGEPVDLTLSEYRLLVLLASQPGRVFTRREILVHLWRSEHVPDEATCKTHISNLRQKIERDPHRAERLVTIRGVGYALPSVDGQTGLSSAGRASEL